MKNWILFGSMLLIVCVILAIWFADPISENKPTDVPQIEGLDVDQDLERNRRLWSEKKIVNYNLFERLVTSGISQPPKSALIEVRDGKAISIKSVSRAHLNPASYYEDYETVEKMFDLIRTNIEIGAKVEVRYNPEFGYPEHIHINESTPKLRSNAWYRIYVDRFEIVK